MFRCRQCDYPLWTVRGRQCPECGSAFKPSDFEFQPSSVRFSCPHCDQDYYGTSNSGHLIPAAFNCVRCQKPVEMDEMVLSPTEGLREEQTGFASNPWLDRLKPERRRGLLGAWWKTVVMSMLHPGELMRATPVDAPRSQAIWFLIFTGIVYFLLGLGMLLLIPLVVAGFQGARGVASSIAGAISAVSVFSLLGLVVATLLWAMASHAVLRLGGRTRGGPSWTLQAFAYSFGANLLNAIPVLNICIGWAGSIWWVISAVFMVKEGQRVSGGRASLAVLTPLVIAGIILGGAYFGAIIFALQKSTTAMNAARARAAMVQQEAAALTLVTALKFEHATTRTDPVYLPKVMIPHKLSAESFVDPAQGPYSIDVQNVSGRQLAILSPTAATPGTPTSGPGVEPEPALPRGVKRIWLSSPPLPPNCVAYRVGDVVFTYSGFGDRWVRPEAVQLWALIFEQGSGGVVVATVNTTVTSIPAADFAQALVDQNALRQSLGLPPLPDPSTVKDDQPALAGVENGAMAPPEEEGKPPPPQ
ncbi:MAG: Yip1 family protein [Planctomycetota bacterium]|nr:Yip1 family protein [Planctomycetota bacterium]